MTAVLRRRFGRTPVAVGGGGGDPLDLPLAQESDNLFTSLGSFARAESMWDGSPGSGGGGMSISEDRTFLYLGRFNGQLGAMNIASIGGTATQKYAFANLPDTVPSDSEVNLGSLPYNGTLYVVRHGVYYPTGTVTKWIQQGNTDITGFTNLRDISGLPDGNHSRRMSQGLVHIPSEWQNLLGGPVAAIGGHLSNASNGQCGFGFATFDPADVAGGGAVSVNALLDYTYDVHYLEPMSDAHPDWASWPHNSDGGNDLVTTTWACVQTAFIPEGSRSLLFITVHGYGILNNGCRPGSSVHNAPYRMQVVAYDLQDLVDVKNGLMDCWEPVPYDWWPFTHPYGACVGDQSSGAIAGSMAYDYVDRKLYGDTELNASNNDILVWQVGSLA